MDALRINLDDGMALVRAWPNFPELEHDKVADWLQVAGEIVDESDDGIDALASACSVARMLATALAREWHCSSVDEALGRVYEALNRTAVRRDQRDQRDAERDGDDDGEQA